MRLRRHPYFFFQAEDGIRDLYVTGVQTCALPICPDGKILATGLNAIARTWSPCFKGAISSMGLPVATRSEERRVGKECRSRWLSDDQKKKMSVHTAGATIINQTTLYVQDVLDLYR